MEQPSTSGATPSKTGPHNSLDALPFDNLALRSLPIDPIPKNYIRQVPNACFSRVEPAPVNNPFTVGVSLPALSLIDLDPVEIKRPDFAEYMSGNKSLPGAEPSAHCYCGHQFGYFSGQLGDGAAMYLGEVVNGKSERWEIQFKGAGLTPYSRQADGRKVLRSSLREFLCSEAMHFLGVPTTRAGCVVSSDTEVIRDIYYNGNPKRERASIVLRIAPTFLRFGSFEIFKPRDPETQREGPSVNKVKLLFKLLDYTVETFYPDIWAATLEDTEARYLRFYQEVVRRTARLVAEWQSVGFCHGVLNTDNMSIVGLTIDYGPYAFLDAYDPDFICNGSDDGGRYTYKNQPEICHWNCQKLAEALALAIPLTDSERELNRIYWPEYYKHYNRKMANKLGLLRKEEGDEDERLFETLFETMYESGADFTNVFRGLSRVTIPSSSETIRELGEDEDEALVYLLQNVGSAAMLEKREGPSIPVETLKMMIAAAQKDPRMLQLFGMTPQKLIREIEKLKKAQQKPQESEACRADAVKHKSDLQVWKAWLKRYRERLQREIGEVSSEEEVRTIQKARVDVMHKHNPRFVLRNYMAQNAIEKAERGDFEETERLLTRVLFHPYDDQDDEELSTKYGYDALPPQWASELCVTCSS